MGSEREAGWLRHGGIGEAGRQAGSQPASQQQHEYII